MGDVWSGPDWRIECGDCLELLKALPSGSVDAVVTDPPYGIAYKSNMKGRLQRSVANDQTTEARNAVLAAFPDIPVLCFGSWKMPRPPKTRMVLVWDKGGALGMGALDLPWKPDHEEIYVLGKGWEGARDCGSVIRCPPVQSTAMRGRVHPTEKPVTLMAELLRKLPQRCTVLDPFMGSGSTGVACLATGRNFIGFEMDRKYCELGARRLADVAPLFRSRVERNQGAELFAREEG